MTYELSVGITTYGLECQLPVHEGQWSAAHRAQLGHPPGGAGSHRRGVRGVRHLELLPPRVHVSLGHRECLVRCRFLAVCDAGELDVFVHGQVDHLACCPGRPGQPAQGRPFVSAPEPVVEHDAGPQPQRLKGAEPAHRRRDDAVVDRPLRDHDLRPGSWPTTVDDVTSSPSQRQVEELKCGLMVAP
jgi:hypothetical protein